MIASRSLFRTGIWVLGALVVVAVLAACGQEATPTATATATPTPTVAMRATPTEQAGWQVEWDELIAAAQAEGELIVVGGSGFESNRGAYEAFGEKFGIEVQMSGGGAGDVASRILAEQEAGKFEVDIIPLGPRAATARLIPNNALDPIEPYLFHPEVVDESLWYGGKHWYVDSEQRYTFAHAASVAQQTFGFTWNTNNVSQDEIDEIESVWDYLDPRWNGRIIAQPPHTISTQSSYFVAFVHPDVGEEWVRQFMFDQDVTFVTDARLMEDQLAGGAYDAAMMTGGTDFDGMETQGLPVRRMQTEISESGKTFAESPYLQTNSSYLLTQVARNPKNPNAAKLFVNWFLSKEGQTASHYGRPEGYFAHPTLRDDVTDWGNTDPRMRREPGRTYPYFDTDPELEAVRDEVVDQTMEWYEEVTGS